MKIRDAVSRAWKLYTGHFGETMQFLLLEVVLRLIVAAPLLFLAAKETQLLSLLCIPLFLLIVPPARACAAEVMQHAIRGESLFSVRLAVTKKYWQKVLSGVGHVLLALVWAVPFLAAVGYVLQIWYGEGVQGQNDIVTLYWQILTLGGGSIEKGVVLLVLAFAGLFLPFLVGCAFHSGRRHERALGRQRIIRGHRGGVMLAWLVSAATVAPFVAVTGFEAVTYVKALLSAFSNMVNGLSIPPVSGPAAVIAAAFVVLLLPLLPLRSLITACYVHGLWEGRE